MPQHNLMAAGIDNISGGRLDFGIGEGATRLELGGFECRRVCDIPVTTSGRLRGRAPDGMAGFLRALEATA